MIATAERGKKKPKKSPDVYARRLAYQADANRKASIAFRDFGPIPKPKDWRRRNKAGKSLRFFCEAYLRDRFNLEWSEDHLRVIRKLEKAIREGGLFALAMPRGSGKTALTIAAALWALLFHWRKFLVLIAATEGLAADLLESIKITLETNDLLLEDFPEVCLPIRKLEGVTNRRLISGGHRVELTLAAHEIHFPWIIGGKNAKSAGSVIQVFGITGAIRGLQVTLPNGTVIRPDFVILDDPQTDESAGSRSQCEAREKKIGGAVLGLAGPGKKISGVMPCTVIEEGDLSDRILDGNIHPEWNGERIALLQSFPENLGLWERYKEVLGDSLRKFGDIRLATKMFIENKSEMERGASVMWRDRFNEDEASAVQNAMNWFLTNPESFWAEAQNNPRQTADDDLKLQEPKEIAKRVDGLKPGKLLAGTQFVTGFVDVQQKCFFYCLIGWRADFTGTVVDYGTFPDQGRRYYQLNDITKTLQRQYPAAAVDGSISAGIREFIPELMKKGFVREDDEAELTPSLILVDANWKTPIVRDAVRSLRNSRVVPSHGRPIGASSNPIDQYKVQRGDQVGLNWKTSTIERIPHVLIDVNFWKSFIHDRLATEFGDAGSLTFPGKDQIAHRLIAEHLTSEYRVRVTASNGRTVDEWKEKASKPDNHFFDCVVGATVGASIMGATVPGLEGPVVKRKRRRPRVSYH